MSDRLTDETDEEEQPGGFESCTRLKAAPRLPPSDHVSAKPEPGGEEPIPRPPLLPRECRHASETATFPPGVRGEARPLTREQRRSSRPRPVRARTIDTERLPKSALELGRRLQPVVEIPRPQNRADCANVPRPCPFVSCRYNLYLDVSPRTGSIKLNFPDLEVWEMKESCSLDVAERGGIGSQHCGELMNVTRECIRKIETRAAQQAQTALDWVRRKRPKAS